MTIRKTIASALLLFVVCLVTACSGGDTPSETPPETPVIVANAGPDQSVFIGTFVTLNGVNSTNSKGTGLNYVWTLNKPSGSAAVLSNANIVNPTMTVDIAGTYEATLVVGDGTMSSTPDTVLIMAAGTNPPPAANAGPDKNIFINQPAVLNGSGSSDANNDPLTFQWSIVKKPTGSTAQLFDSTTVTPSFTPDKEGPYKMSLIVNDGTTSSPPATMTLTATSKPPPTVDVGVARPFQRFVPLNTASVSLNGSASHTNPPANPPSNFLDYLWTVTPQGGAPAVTLANERTAIASFSPPANTAGTYVATLKVTERNHPNPKSNSATQSLTVTIGPRARVDVYRDSISAANLLSSCILSPCASVSVQSATTIRFDGGGSLVQPLTNQWSLTPPDGMDGQTTATPSWTPSNLGIFTVKLTVTDAGGNPNTRSVPINVVTGPTASSPSITVGGLVVGSVAPNTDAVLRANIAGTTNPTCTWAPVPPNSIITQLTCNPGTNGATANFRATVEANYATTLTVQDSIGSNPLPIGVVVNTAPTVSFTASRPNPQPTSGCLTLQLNGSASSPNSFPGQGVTWNWSVSPAVTLDLSTPQVPTFIVKNTTGYTVTVEATENGAPADSATGSTTDSVNFPNENAGHGIYHAGIANVTTGACMECHQAGTHDTTINPIFASALKDKTIVGKSAGDILAKLNSSTHYGKIFKVDGTQQIPSLTGSADQPQATNLASFLAVVGCLERGLTAGH